MTDPQSHTFTKTLTTMKSAIVFLTILSSVSLFGVKSSCLAIMLVDITFLLTTDVKISLVQAGSILQSAVLQDQLFCILNKCKNYLEQNSYRKGIIPFFSKSYMGSSLPL